MLAAGASRPSKMSEELSAARQFQHQKKHKGRGIFDGSILSQQFLLRLL